MAARRRLWLEYRFELDLDADLLGDDEPAAIQGQVPGQAPVLPVDGARGGEDGPVAAPGVGGIAEVLGFQGDRPVTPRRVRSPASTPLVPCQPDARAEKVAVG